jgi:DNA-binding Xre family transcriptional regulator
MSSDEKGDANPHAGSSFDDFLRADGQYGIVTATALKRVVARQLAHAMAEQQMTKTEMARRLNTSRAQLDRLLDPENTKVQLETLQRAASALGRSLEIGLVDAPDRASR